MVEAVVVDKAAELFEDTVGANELEVEKVEEVENVTALEGPLDPAN
jgi:hypothetical protein